MFKILVLEDDNDLNQTVCSFLNQSGYEAAGCLTADGAYDAMYNNTFDLIVSDIMMPGIDGYEFAKTVREQDENIPILFMTARDDFASKQRGYRIGIDDYMIKPIDLEGLLLLIVPRLVKENPRRGVIIQAMYRSNFVLFGLPLTTVIYGPEQSAVAAMLVAVVLTVYNITSVVILELFNDHGDPNHKLSAKTLLVKLAKNPMLQGCAVGLVFFFFQIRLPDCLASPIASFANMTTPLAMFALGGTLRFKAISKNLRYLVPTLLGKLVIVPLILASAAYAMGLRGVELFLVVAVFGTPVASGSYPMAMNMGGDGELAGQFVFTGTVLSLFTLFIWIVVLDQTGLLLL